MLKRIYVNNYKCLNNFELSFDRVALLLGNNGSGKSTVFEALALVRALLTLGSRTFTLFTPDNWSMWVTSANQTFEIDFQDNENVYRYALTLRRDEDSPLAVIDSEQLWLNDNPLVEFKAETVHLYRDDFSLDSSYPHSYSQSAVAQIPVTTRFRSIERFKNLLTKQLIITQINPPLMRSLSKEEDEILRRKSDNFTSWYRYISRNQRLTFDITQELMALLDGFSHFEFIEAGDQARILQTYFVTSGSSGRERHAYRFEDVSDGQRALIALYTVYHYARSTGATLCIDEPENFVALPEIQPWLRKLYDACEDGEMQAILISHHPEFIDYLASSNGIWFERESNQPTRTKRIDEDEAETKISDLVAKGWIDA